MGRPLTSLKIADGAQGLKEYFKTRPLLAAAQQRYEYALWKLHGETRGGAAHLYKQKTIATYSRTYDLPVLVETGTYLGAMVYAMRNTFRRIYSVELSHGLFIKAQARFRPFPHITILEGSSAAILPQLLHSICEPVLFWLDGHYSGGITARGEKDTPVLSEVRVILQQMKQEFVILIDDARLFVGNDGYPTLRELREFVTTSKPDMQFLMDKDIIRIFPRQQYDTIRYRTTLPI
jgi:hypothetical protein